MSENTPTTENAAAESEPVTVPEGVITRKTFLERALPALEPEEPEEPEAAADPQPATASIDVTASEPVAKLAAQIREDVEGAMQEPAPSIPAMRYRAIIDRADDKITDSITAGRYGTAEENLTRIAALWTARDMFIGNRVFDATDVGQMLALAKASDIAASPDSTSAHSAMIGMTALAAEVSGA